MSISSVWHGLPKGVQTATKVGGLVAGGAGIMGITAACASPKPSADIVREEFNRFDRDGKDGVGTHEAELSGQRTYTTTRDYRFLDSDYVTRTYSTRQQTWTDSALRGVGAADEKGNKDAVASWQELTNLAMSYDVDGDSMLGGDEREKFDRDYGVRRIDHGTRILNEYSLPVFDPLPRYDPPYRPPTYEPPTSGGDSGYDYGNGSGNSSGDSGGSWDSGNSGGDSGYIPSPGSGSSGDSGGVGDSGGSSSNGNSTSNGNAEW